MRQGNDVGTPVPLRHLHGRRGRQAKAADLSARRSTAMRSQRADKSDIIDPDRTRPACPHHAEDYHQQYLSDAKNPPAGYCSMSGTGVSCPIGAGVPAS